MLFILARMFHTQTNTVAVKVITIREKNFKYVIEEIANHRTVSHAYVVFAVESNRFVLDSKSTPLCC
jgi:hypothetical protein